jgi:5-methylcytosine-specific restriction enzyme A
VPTMPPHRCAVCHTLVLARTCPHCRTRRDLARPNASARGYTSTRWRQLRAQKLQHDPLCSVCLAAGRTMAATQVDHLDRHDGPDDPRFWDWSNLDSKCASCHSRKTALHDSAFVHRGDR